MALGEVLGHVVGRRAGLARIVRLGRASGFRLVVVRSQAAPIKAPPRAARSEAPPTWDAGARDTGSLRPRWYVEHDGGRAFVEKSLDELHERVWILKVGIRIEARGDEECSVALDASIYPPRPHFLTLTPAPDLYSGHASPSFRFGELRRAFGS